MPFIFSLPLAGARLAASGAQMALRGIQVTMSALRAMGAVREALHGLERTRLALRVKVQERNRWGELKAAIRAAAQEAVLDVAQDLADDWKARVHVISGAYRDSIHLERQADGSILVTAGVPYAHIEEFGSVYRPGHPAFVPAVEQARRTLEKTMQQAFQRRLR